MQVKPVQNGGNALLPPTRQINKSDVSFLIHYINIDRKLHDFSLDKFAIHNSIFISGGAEARDSFDGSRYVDVLGQHTCDISPLPSDICLHSMLLNNDNELMVLGGDGPPDQIYQDCLVYRKSAWKYHSKLMNPRISSSAVNMSDGIYIFGGRTKDWKRCLRTCEFLPNSDSQWRYLDTSIPKPGYMGGSAIAISNNEILLTGGNAPTKKRMMTFNTSTLKWTLVGDLIHERNHHRSFIFNNRIIVCGGFHDGFLRSTEIIQSLHPLIIKEGGHLIEGRCGHGLDVINIKGTPTLVAFGGHSIDQKCIDSVETWNDKEECWEMTDWKLPHQRWLFASCSKDTRIPKSFGVKK